MELERAYHIIRRLKQEKVERLNQANSGNVRLGPQTRGAINDEITALDMAVTLIFLADNKPEQFNGLLGNTMYVDPTKQE